MNLIEKLLSLFKSGKAAKQENVTVTPELTPKEKGDAFENYIIGKFDRRFFSLKDMRSDKGSNGFYPESNKYPDLVLEYKPDSKRFAIECKWRKDW